MLSAIQREYEAIMHTQVPARERNRRLAALMTYMEQTYHIPLVVNVEWERKNKAVIAMYRKLSMSRRI